MEKIKAIIVDDHELFRLGLRISIESRHSDLCVVGEAQFGTELFALLKTVAADIVLLDMFLPDISGIEIARRLKTEYPELKILVFSEDNSASTIMEMIDIGIDGFISIRKGGVDVFAEAIRSIMQGINFFGKDILEIIYNSYLSIKRTTAINVSLCFMLKMPMHRK